MIRGGVRLEGWKVDFGAVRRVEFTSLHGRAQQAIGAGSLRDASSLIKLELIIMLDLRSCAGLDGSCLGEHNVSLTD